jgi:hypothetical protein
MIGVGYQGEKSRLTVASRRRPLGLGAAIILQLEQGKLAAVLGAPYFKLLAAQFDKTRPTVGASIDDDRVGLRHGTSRGLGGCLRLLQAVQEIRRALRMGRGGEDRALVVLKNLDPRPAIGDVVRADFGGQFEVGAKKR